MAAIDLGGRARTARNVVLAVRPFAAARLLREAGGDLAVAPELVCALGNAAYDSIATVYLAWPAGSIYIYFFYYHSHAYTSRSLEGRVKTIEEAKKEAIENKTSKISTLEQPIRVYSDGSDIKGTGMVGFGAVYKYQDKEFGVSGTNEGEAVQDLQAKFPNAKFSNPTMEMLALATVLETFQDTGEHLYIHQDYSGAVNYNGLWQRSEGSLQCADKPWKDLKSHTSNILLTKL